MGGFLTDTGGKVYLHRVQILLSQLGDIEDGVFKNRTTNNNQRAKREENKRIQKRRQRIYNRKKTDEEKRQAIPLNECKLSDEYDENQVAFLEFFNEYELEIDDHFMEKDFEHKLKHIHRTSQNISKVKNKCEEKESEKIVFGEKGFKQKYYFSKMKFNYDEKPAMLNKLTFEYIRGIKVYKSAKIRHKTFLISRFMLGI